VFQGFLAAQPLTLCTESAPPWHFAGADGQPQGPVVEVVRQIQRRVGNRDPIRLVPWARGYAMALGQPNVALFLMARTKERDAHFHWVGPVVESVYSLYVKADSKRVLRTLEDAKALRAIGVYRDDARDQMLTREGFLNLERTTDNVMNARKLLAGRIDAMVSSEIGVQDLLKVAGVDRGAVKEALPVAHVQLWIAFSKGTPRHTVVAWERAFEGLRSDRTLERIMKKDIPTWTLPGPARTTF